MLNIERHTVAQVNKEMFLLREEMERLTEERDGLRDEVAEGSHQVRVLIASISHAFPNFPLANFLLPNFLLPKDSLSIFSISFSPIIIFF